MLTTINHTPFDTRMLVLQNRDGYDTAVAVTKATFSLDGNTPSVSGTQQPIVFSDRYRGRPGKSSLLHASETTMPKPFTDIVMNGHAYGRGRSEILVSLTVGRYEKTVKVSGVRYWKGMLSMTSMTGPEPFARIPLDYEHAFGGEDEHASDPSRKETWPENPVGMGFIMNGGKNQTKGIKIAPIENPSKRIKDPWSRYSPEGFGYMAPHWMPRSGFAGTFNDRWLRERMPFLPEDFNPRFYNAAHPDLITREYLAGNEPVAIINATPDGALKFRLPGLRIHTVFHVQGTPEPAPSHLDTLILEPDERRLMMVYRASMGCDKKMYHVES
ncbi:MAG: DUF2169 domain-containing protein, partial [Pseudomonadota bacterium]